MKGLKREIRYRGGIWGWLVSPVFGVVRNPTNLGLYCGWFVLWFDWGNPPILDERFSFGWDID